MFTFCATKLNKEGNHRPTGMFLSAPNLFSAHISNSECFGVGSQSLMLWIRVNRRATWDWHWAFKTDFRWLLRTIYEYDLKKSSQNSQQPEIIASPYSRLVFYINSVTFVHMNSKTRLGSAMTAFVFVASVYWYGSKINQFELKGGGKMHICLFLSMDRIKH